MCLKQEYSSRFRILKGGKISLIVSAFLGSTIIANAAPTGGTVTSGTATISQSGNTTNITQSSNKASINWQNFSISSNETVNFNQPNSSSITLNRVIGNEKSIIDGSLNANGQVWILNSNGTLFGKNAKVNTSGLLVTTKNLSDDDFQKGNYSFKGNSKESIENQGEINLNDKAYAIFVANSVINNGEIKVHKGTVHLIGADEFSLTLNENSNISLKVTKGTLNSLVENNNLIVANGGNVYLTTNAKNELLKGVVNNSGIIEAASLDDLQSEVIVYAHGGTANISGEIKAKNSFVETSGKDLNVTNEAKITAKTWLLDPTNITIESTGGSIGNESVSATAVQNALSSADIILQADNNIAVNQNITWSEATQLRLTADNINVNATINNTNQTNGGVYFNAANRSNKVVFGINGKVIVNNVYQLQWINTALAGKYELGSNIDASATTTWNSGAGFNPIGNITNSFTGILDGKNYAISNLIINRPTENGVGVFSLTSADSIIQNIGFDNVNIKGKNYSGGLVGDSFGTIKNSYVMGTVDLTGGAYVGGFVGGNRGTIENSYFEGTVIGGGRTGGFVGWNDGITGAVIRNSYFKGTVTGTSFVGGFASSGGGTIENSYASGTVNGTVRIGGLIGQDNGFTITNSWYDNEANSLGSMEDSEYGKTKAEIVSLLNGSEWTTDSSEGRGYGTAGTIILPFLRNVTKLSNTLFEDGLGTSTNPYTITNWTQLQNINNSNILTQNYYFNLLNNLDNSTADYFTFNSGLGWNPIGDNSTLDNNSRFIGTFDGLGHTISDLYLSRSGTSNVGLFGASANGSIIENLGLLSTTIYGNYYVGAIAGRNYGTISNSYTTGNVSGSLDVGGLAGRNYGTISNSYTLADVTGIDLTGGLVGYNFGGTISNSYASGTVTGTYNIGGLVGNNSGIINSSFYDNEANTSTSMSDTSRGKTKAEILALVGSPWSNAIWGITAGGTSVEGYEGVLLPYLLNVTRDEDKSKSIFFAGGFGTSNDAYEITNWTQLQNINNLGVLNQNYYFKLLNNLDSQTSDYTNLASSTANGGLGWRSIGNNSTFDDNSRFRGTFDGQGNTISDLYIKQLTGQSASNVGLFGYITTGATIQNIGLLNVDITGLYSVGGLLGYNNGGTIENSYVTGAVSGTERVGGFVGYNFLGTVKSSYFNGAVSGTHQIGGLTGRNYTASINNSYAIGSVTANGGSAGGLVGANEIGATITNSYASTTVNGVGNVGGLAGNNNGNILNSFYDNTQYTGNGIGNDASYTGVIGLTTQQMSYGKYFKDASWDIVADSSVTSTTPVIKYDSLNGEYYWAIAPIALTYTLSDKTTTYDGTTQNLSSFYSSNPLSIPTGYEFLNLTSSDYKFQVNGTDVTEYKDAGTYSNIKVALNGNSATNEFLTIANSGNTDGTLTINKANATVTANSNSLVYNGTSQSISGFEVSGLVAGETKDVLTGLTGITTTGKNAGIYNTNIAGTDTNYNLTFNQGTLTINKKDLTINNVIAQNKTYDGTNSATLSNIGNLVGLVNNEELELTQTSSTFSDKNASDGKTVTVSGYTISDKNGNLASNYNLTQTSKTTTANIAKKDVSATYTAQDKTYDGTTNVTVNGTSNDFIVNDNVSFTQTANFIDKNAGTNKTVNVSNIALSGTDAQNYNLVNDTSSTTANISKANAIVTANSNSVVYNGTFQSVTGFTVSGLVNNETQDVLTELTGITTTGKNAGIYNTNIAGTDTNYNLTFNQGKLIITPKDITVIADNKTKTQGEENPSLTYIANGLIGDDILNGNLTTNAIQNSEVGNYDIEKGSLDNSNYNIDFTKGTLSVLSKPIPIPEPQPIIDKNIQKVVDSINDSLVLKQTNQTKTFPNIEVIGDGIKLPINNIDDEIKSLFAQNGELN